MEAKSDVKDSDRYDFFMDFLNYDILGTIDNSHLA